MMADANGISIKSYVNGLLESAVAAEKQKGLGVLRQVIGIVRVTQVVDKLTDSDDRLFAPAGHGGRGSYVEHEVTAAYTPTHPDNWRDEFSEETEGEKAVLDAFHSLMPVGCLEDFSFDVVEVKEAVLAT